MSYTGRQSINSSNVPSVIMGGGQCTRLKSGQPKLWVEPFYERSGVDAGTALCLHSGRQRPGATHRERWAYAP
jgi:hypothetical protein